MRPLSAAFVLAGWLCLQSPLFAQVPMGGGGTGGGGTGGGGGNGGGTGTRGTTGGTGSSGNFAPTGGIGFGSSGPSLQTGTGTGPSRGAGANAIPTPINPFLSYFGNPLGVGMSGTTTTTTGPKAAFGQPLFGAVTSTNIAASQAGSDTGTSTGFNTVGMRKAPPYITVLGDDIPLIQHPPAQLQRSLQDVLQRSSTLKGKDNIAVTVSDATAILRGQVPSERERRLAESLIRLTPGVLDVRNELSVGP